MNTLECMKRKDDLCSMKYNLISLEKQKHTRCSPNILNIDKQNVLNSLAVTWRGQKSQSKKASFYALSLSGFRESE